MNNVLPDSLSVVPQRNEHAGETATEFTCLLEGDTVIGGAACAFPRGWWRTHDRGALFFPIRCKEAPAWWWTLEKPLFFSPVETIVRRVLPDGRAGSVQAGESGDWRKGCRLARTLSLPAWVVVFPERVRHFGKRFPQVLSYREPSPCVDGENATACALFRSLSGKKRIFGLEI